MSEEAKPTPAAVEDSRTAAEGARSSARWIAAALAAIPSLGFLSSIIRAPGDQGFDAFQLALGMGLAALGAVIGILVFSWVLSPVALEDSDLEGVEVKKLPGHPYGSFAEVTATIRSFRQSAVNTEYEIAKAEVGVKRAEAAALRAEAEAKKAEAAAKQAEADGDPEKDRLKGVAEQAKLRAAELKARADAAAADARAIEPLGKFYEGQVDRAQEVRSDLYRLKASEVVRTRFAEGKWSLIPVVALIAAGIVLLGLAPIEKAAEPGAPAPELVRLRVNKTGRDLLACENRSLQALRVGGDDKTPLVVTFPAEGCPAQTIHFATEGDGDLGSYVPGKVRGTPAAAEGAGEAAE